MKKIFVLALVFLVSCGLNAQRVAWITLSQSNAEPVITVFANDAFINLSTDGNMLEYGVEYAQGRLYYFPGKLDKYMGRVELYNDNANAACKGKIRYIGASSITYFSAEENEKLAGKIKSIGNMFFEYYMPYDDATFAGKIKSAGRFEFNYCGNFDDEKLKGKIKSAGNINIGYYGSFDDKALRGKLKNVGQYNFTYYTSFDARYQGSMKSGFQTQLINGIKFIVR